MPARHKRIGVPYNVSALFSICSYCLARLYNPEDVQPAQIEPITLRRVRDANEQVVTGRTAQDRADLAAIEYKFTDRSTLATVATSAEGCGHLYRKNLAQQPGGCIAIKSLHIAAIYFTTHLILQSGQSVLSSRAPDHGLVRLSLLPLPLPML
jgi:hypothetical protein